MSLGALVTMRFRQGKMAHSECWITNSWHGTLGRKKNGVKGKKLKLAFFFLHFFLSTTHQCYPLMSWLPWWTEFFWIVCPKHPYSLSCVLSDTYSQQQPKYPKQVSMWSSWNFFSWNKKLRDTGEDSLIL